VRTGTRPYRLRRWRWRDGDRVRFFFTCARPGRTSKFESKTAQISDRFVREWLRALPGPSTALVSLLGCKPDGTSEYKFYSFCGGYEKPEDRPGRQSFREWLDQWSSNEPIPLREHPTRDFDRVPDDLRVATAESIAELLRSGHTVVLIDSGGEQRTRQICDHMKAIEDSSNS